MAGGPAVDLSIGTGITTTLTVLRTGELDPRDPDHTLSLEIGAVAAQCWDPPADDPQAASYFQAKAWWEE
jgi:hypothetical protein